MQYPGPPLRRGGVVGGLVPVDRRPPLPRPADPSEVCGVGEGRLTAELFGGLRGVSRRHLDILHKEPEPAWRQAATQLIDELRREVEEVTSATAHLDLRLARSLGTAAPR